MLLVTEVLECVINVRICRGHRRLWGQRRVNVHVTTINAVRVIGPVNAEALIASLVCLQVISPYPAPVRPRCGLQQSHHHCLFSTTIMSAAGLFDTRKQVCDYISRNICAQFILCVLQLTFYGAYHNNPINVAIHIVCVPLILW